MRKLLSLLCLLTLFCPAAQALTLPYPADTVISVRDMTPAQRALAEALYVPIFNHEESIQLPGGTRYDDVPAAMEALMQDYPELFHLGRNYTVTYYWDKPEIAISVQPQYRMTAGEAASTRAALYVRAALLAEQYPIALSLHDAMCSLVVYGGEAESCNSAVGVLLEGYATCEGYAHALTLLYRMAGIPCGVVIGDAVDAGGVTERHAWNIVDLGDYTLIDATWNDQDHLGLNTHWYYGLSTRQMGADHFPDAGQRIPRCGEQDNWHVRQGRVIASVAQADAAIRHLVGGEVVNLRVTKEGLYRELAYGTYDFLTGYNERNSDAPFYGMYSVTCSDAQQCVVIRQVEE